MTSFFYSPNYNMLNCVYLYLLPLVLYPIQILFAYEPLLFVGKLSRAHGVDASTEVFKSPGHRIESATAKFFFSSRLFYTFSLCHFIELLSLSCV